MNLIPRAALAAAVIAGALVPQSVSAANMNLQGGTLDFNKGSSRVFDDGQLHVRTDDYLFLDAPKMTFVQSGLSVNDGINVNHSFYKRYTGSKIYDNGNLTLQTDDHLYLDAPERVVTQNHLTAVGQLVVYANQGANGPVLHVSGTGATVKGTLAPEKLSVGGGTAITGIKKVAGEAGPQGTSTSKLVSDSAVKATSVVTATSATTAGTQCWVDAVAEGSFTYTCAADPSDSHTFNYLVTN